MKNFRVWDGLAGEMIKFDFHDVYGGKVNDHIHLDDVMQGLGIVDASGKGIFEGDILRVYTSTLKQLDGSFKPKYEYFQIDSIEDLYGSPFRGGSYCDIIGNKHKGGA